MEDITDADYVHAKRVCTDFEIKNAGKYYGLYVQSNILLLAVVFENFRNMCRKIYKLDPAKFLQVPGLPWLVAFKKNEVKLDLLSDIDMFLLIEKGIQGGICCSICRYTKANNKYMKDFDKKLSYLQDWNVNNLCGWAMSQKLPVNNFQSVKDTYQFNEDFISNYKKVIKIFSWSWFSISWKITWTSYWFTIYSRKKSL